MSTNPEDMMRMMAAENSAMGEAMKTPPPNAESSVVQTPALDKIGLELFQPHMTENGFNTFLTLVHWAILQQDLHEGKTIKYTNETYAAMNAVFAGFGNSFLWESTYEGNVGKFVNLFHFNWYSKGKRFRTDNPLPHKIIRELAGFFANTGKGFKHAEMIQDLVEDPSSYSRL